MQTVRSRLAPAFRLGLAALAGALIAAILTAGGVDAVPTYRESAGAAWRDVQDQYRSRADLVPRLVEAVRGHAGEEGAVLAAVAEAGARAGETRIDAGRLSDPAAIERFQAAQDDLSGALSRLFVTVERYPELKSDDGFLALQRRLEGAENRIAVARRDYLEAVRDYNAELDAARGRWWAGWFDPDALPMQAFPAASVAQAQPRAEFGAGTGGGSGVGKGVSAQ